MYEALGSISSTAERSGGQIHFALQSSLLLCNRDFFKICVFKITSKIYSGLPILILVYIPACIHDRLGPADKGEYVFIFLSLG